MRGCWFGIGVGSGDPELMTLKAVRIIKECGVIVLPHQNREQCVAYQIAVKAVPELAEKTILCLPMPMTKDQTVLEQSHRQAAERIVEYLDQGVDVASLTLGDTCVYSTCLYIEERLSQMGYQTNLVNGIPSFCAVAARLGIGLVNGREELHIIPASYQIEEALKLPGVKVLMKAGRSIPKVKQLLKERNLECIMVENCGMDGERIYRSVEEIPDDTGYYALFIVR